MPLYPAAVDGITWRMAGPDAWALYARAVYDAAIDRGDDEGGDVDDDGGT